MDCIDGRHDHEITAVVADTVPVSDLADFFGRAFVEVAQTLRDQGIAITGPAFACYRRTDGDLVTVEAGFPVRLPVTPTGDVRPSELPATRAAFAEHHGPYEELPAAYQEMQSWMAARGLAPGEAMWEQYLGDPAGDGLTTVTRVVWPVEEASDRHLHPA